MRLTHALAAAAIALMTTPAAHAGDAAVEAPILTMVQGFNTGNVKLAKSAHVAAPVILDEPIAPYVWSGPKAFDTWIAALSRSEAAAGKTDGQVAIGPFTRESVTGGRAYVIAPSTYTFKQGGRTMRETGTLTFALAKFGTVWKIAAWTWTSPEAVPVE